MSDRSRRKSSSPSNGSRPKRSAGQPSQPPATQPPATQPPATQPAATQPEPSSWEPWLQLGRRWFPAIGIVVAVATGSLFGLGTALLVLAATALLSAVSAIWASLQWIAGDSVDAAEDTLSLVASGVEVEQKQAVLRALKDLEYERSVGKISEQDYQELRERYRARARAVLQDLDRELEPTRQQAEQVVAAFLRSKGIEASQSLPAAEASPEPKGKPIEAAEPTSRDRARKCPACSTTNDADAAFCKKCGHRIDESPRAEAGAEP